jgi:lysophospholipase L1-like esterase
MSQMNADIAAIAAQYGFAHFELEALYGRSDIKAPFSAVTVMTTAQPYGPLVSLDGIHPSGAGHRILADAAVQAVNTTYNLGLPASSSIIASR